jgi:single-stranded-DNA-specific exonuclease
MNYRWTLRAVDDEALVARLAQHLNDLPPSLARALALRGVRCMDTARSFFRAGLEATHDPFLLKDMDAAADRLAHAITTSERVLVFGDYDVDGTTATAVMVHFLRTSGVDATFFLPNRFEHGYGLCAEGIDAGVARGASLIVALDCGITAVEEARYARQQGVDLIIADHHEPGEELPEAVAVLDPKRADCSYPFAGLSGCGVGFKLIQATLQRLGRDPAEALPYLDLLAISIAADIVPVLDENRVLMRHGLARLASEPRVGLKALADVARIPLEHIDGTRIVFGFGPRINAAGRLGSADRAVELFLEEDPRRAMTIAQELEEINVQRRDLDARTLAQAMAQAAIQIHDDPAALVLFHPDWHPGVLGIVAARIAEHYHRPAILLAGADVAKGSARSIHGISIYRALAACADHLLTFGGHDAAAGLSLDPAGVDDLRDALHEAIGQISTPEEREPEILLDADLHLGDIGNGHGSRFWAVLRQFGPYGPDNPRPVFWARDLEVARRPQIVGKDRKHLRMIVRQRGAQHEYPVIGFGLGDRLAIAEESASRGVPLELACCVNENRYNGRVMLQLEAKDIRLHEAP